MMKRLARNNAARLGMAGAFASAMLFALPAFAQQSRLSLADRVSRLEQKAQSNDQSGIGMVNRVQQLQEQVQQLQGQVEELQHHVQILEDKNKAKYADLDARLARLEGGARPAAAGTSASNPPVPVVAPVPAASASVQQAAAPADPADAASADAAYEVAFKSIRAGNYAQAAREFRSFTQQYPNHPLAPNAWYWLGESYYATTNYSVALEAFQQLLSAFPQSDKADDALLKVGYSQVELKQYDAAKATLTEVTTRYPGSKVAALAAERLRRLQQSGN